MTNRLLFVLLLSVCLIGSNAQAGIFGGPKIKIVQLMPSEINLAGIKRVAILPIKFDERDRILNKIASTVHKHGEGITLIEREQLDRILAEQNLVASELVDLDSTPDLGAIQGVDALIYGTATVFSIEDQNYLTEVTWTEYYKEDGEHKTRKMKATDIKATKREGNLNLTLKLVAVSTGAIIAQKEFITQSDHTHINHKKSDKKELLPTEQHISEQLISALMSDIAKYMFPFPVRREIELDEKCGTDECKEAIDMLKMEMFDMADENLTDFLEVVRKRTKKRKEKKGKDQGLAAILYNLGVAKEAQGDFPAAQDYYKEAIMVTLKKKNKHHKKGYDRVRNHVSSWELYNQKATE